MQKFIHTAEDGIQIRQENPIEMLNMRPSPVDGIAVTIGGQKFRENPSTPFAVEGRFAEGLARWFLALPACPEQPTGVIEVDKAYQNQACFYGEPTEKQRPILNEKDYLQSENPANGSDFNVPRGSLAFMIATLADDLSELTLQIHPDVLVNHNLVIPYNCARQAGEWALRRLDLPPDSH